MRWSRVADYCFCAPNVSASRPRRKVRKFALFPRENFPNYLLADFCFGRRNGLFFEKDERCSSVIAVKYLGTR
jgi:hypothetical protein